MKKKILVLLLAVCMIFCLFACGDDLETADESETSEIFEEEVFEEELTDGSYSMVFEMKDASGSYAYSDQVTFDVMGSEIYTTVYED